MDAVSGDAGPRPGLLEGADPDVDWPAAIRRVRTRGLVKVLPVLGFPVGVVLLTGDFFGVPRPAAWWVAAGVGLLLVAAGVVASVWTTRRTRPRKTAVVQAALHERADPGPALRGEVDWSAREQRAYRWAWPFTCFGALSFSELGRWGSPATAVPGALLVALFWGAVMANVLGPSAAARRWLTDPPGPPRPMPPLAAWERRRTTRFLLLGAPWLLALGLVASVVVRAVPR